MVVFLAVFATVFVPATYPVRVVVILTVERVPGATPVTVTRPLSLIDAEAPAGVTSTAAHA